MLCSIANVEFNCPGATLGNCTVFLDEGVTVRNDRGKCNFKNLRNPNKRDKKKSKVNPLKASKREGGK